jgi:hypothetical protein
MLTNIIIKIRQSILYSHVRNDLAFLCNKKWVTADFRSNQQDTTALFQGLSVVTLELSDHDDNWEYDYGMS